MSAAEHVASLTADQVNREIAVRRGDDMGAYADTPDGESTYWRSCGTRACPLRHIHEAKEYCGSWGYAGPLFEELRRDGEPLLRIDGDGWAVVYGYSLGYFEEPCDMPPGMIERIVIHGATARECCARAWLITNWERT